MDEHTLNLSRAKFARLCAEIELAQPLKQGCGLVGKKAGCW